jgi:hypothetical protein
MLGPVPVTQLREPSPDSPEGPAEAGMLVVATGHPALPSPGRAIRRVSDMRREACCVRFRPGGIE